MKGPTADRRSRTRVFISATCAALLGLVAFSQTAFAVPVTWAVNGTFADGGTISGSLTYDADTNIMSAWNLAVAGGDTGTFPSFVYSDSINNSFLDFAGTDDKFIFCSTVDCNNNVQRRDLRLAFGAPLTDAGGMATLLAGPVLPSPEWGLECFNCGPVRYIVSGSATTGGATAVPEPGTVALFGLGLVAFGLMRRRRVPA